MSNQYPKLTPSLVRKAYAKVANQTGKPMMVFEAEVRAWARAFGWDEEKFLKDLGYEKPIYGWPFSDALKVFNKMSDFYCSDHDRNGQEPCDVCDLVAENKQLKAQLAAAPVAIRGAADNPWANAFQVDVGLYWEWYVKTQKLLNPALQHVWHKCPPDEQPCYVCHNDLEECAVCGQAEGDLEVFCPGKKVSPIQGAYPYSYYDEEK